MDDVFKALADPSRRRLLDRLFKRDGQTLGELCERVSMTRFGVMKHLRVLEEAGLVVTRRSGREKLHYLNPVPIRLVHDRWVSKYAAPFAAALSQLKSHLEGTNMESKVQVYQVFIRTTPEKLWQALTDGEVTKNYLFSETLHSDWKRGSEWYSTAPNGARDVEGTVVESDPPRRLVLTWRALYNPDLSKEQSRVSYLIERRGEVCKLTVTHELSEAPLTAKHVDADGWQLILSGLKTLLETGQPMPMPEAAA
jgi:DNA-binding transcriptional ArsR family regulator